MPKATLPQSDVLGPLPLVVDLTRVTPDVGTVRSTLDALASDLRALWSSALADGDDFATIERLVAASHAVHMAAVALAQDSVVAGTAGPAGEADPRFRSTTPRAGS